MAEQIQLSGWLRGALAAGGLFLGLIGVGSSILWNTLVDRLESLEQQMATKRIRVNLLAEQLAQSREHEVQADRATTRVFARVEKLEDQMRELFTDAHSRPDPFTGADGQRLRELIDANERRLDQCERCCDKVTE